MTLHDLKDYFKVENYPKNAQGHSDVPPSDIQEFLASKFPLGYSFTVAAQGYTPDGYAYYTGNLVLQDESGFSHTVSGSAQNEPDAPIQMGFAGLAKLALRNAVLTWVGAGHSLYMRDPIATKAAPVAQAPRQQQAPASSNDDWDGSEKVGIGKFKGTATTWAQVEDGYLKFVTSGDRPNKNALKEIARRRKPSTNGRVADVLNENPFA